MSRSSMLSALLATKRGNWNSVSTIFIPPRAPHWGGKRESAVRCVKPGNRHLYVEYFIIE